MQTLNNDEKDVLFFYGKNASKNIKMAMPNIYKAILNNIKNIKYNTNDTVNKSNTELIDNEKIANDILKFKNLLDIGAITQEEYDAKKKEILGL
ncbi:MAG: SHOCT domain-containing protein [Ruminococcus sp.]|nr:SHOCT domain-containing protein [Ruminococcus sp.]